MRERFNQIENTQFKWEISIILRVEHEEDINNQTSTELVELTIVLRRIHSRLQLMSSFCLDLIEKCQSMFTSNCTFLLNNLGKHEHLPTAKLLF